METNGEPTYIADERTQLEEFLDSNRDGSVVDDITRLAGQFFGRRQ